jgi:hypothetical protein
MDKVFCIYIYMYTILYRYMHYVYILSIHIYISRGKPNRSNSKPCPNGILGPSPARMDCMCFATACQNWWCARAFIPCQKRSPLDHLDRLLDMENPAFVGQSSTAPYLPIFLTFSFFFLRGQQYITPRPGVEKWFNKSPLSTTWTSRRCEKDGSMVHQWTVHGGFL